MSHKYEEFLVPSAKYFGLLIPGTHVQSIEDIKVISIPIIGFEKEFNHWIVL